MGDESVEWTRATMGSGKVSAAWPLDALLAAIARASEVGEDKALAGRTVDEIRRALVQVQRVCRDAERAAEQALALLAGDGIGRSDRAAPRVVGNGGRVEIEENDAAERRACDWMARWLRTRSRPPWDGSAGVVLRAYRLVVAFDDGDPVDVAAPPRHRFRLRIAPVETPAVSLEYERDIGPALVRAVVWVPPTLRPEPS